MRIRRPSARVVALASAATVLGIGGVAYAATGGAGGGGEFTADLAAELGIEQETLEEAMKQVALERVDERVAAGAISEEQAAELRERIESGELGPPPGHHGGPLLGPGLEAAASYLGLTVEEVRTALADGRSLAGLAEGEGKSVEGLVDALVAAAKERIQRAVEDGRLGESEAEARIAELEERVAEQVERSGGPCGPGGIGPGPGSRGEDGDATTPEQGDTATAETTSV
jgi:hypothetical protein